MTTTHIEIHTQVSTHTHTKISCKHVHKLFEIINKVVIEKMSISGQEFILKNAAGIVPFIIVPTTVDWKKVMGMM